jgi:lysozyme family protein
MALRSPGLSDQQGSRKFDSDEKIGLLNLYFEHLHQCEGGYADHPDDPGGRTICGITAATASKLNMAEEFEKLIDLYRADDPGYPALRDKFIDAYYSSLGIALDYPSIAVSFWLREIAFMSGPNRAVKTLQHAANVILSTDLLVDGIMGPQTRAALALLEDVPGTFSTIVELRMNFLRSLSHFKSFERGWTSRVKALDVLIKKSVELNSKLTQQS